MNMNREEEKKNHFFVQSNNIFNVSLVNFTFKNTTCQPRGNGHMVNVIPIIYLLVIYYQLLVISY